MIFDVFKISKTLKLSNVQSPFMCVEKCSKVQPVFLVCSCYLGVVTNIPPLDSL